MRKIFLAFIVCFVMAANVASAAMVRVSDDDVQKVIHSIADVIYTDEFQKETPLLLTNAVKFENVELPEIGNTAWGCQYGLKTATAPDGEIVFFVDDEEKVSALKIVAYSEKAGENAVVLLFTTLQTLGLTQADAELLINKLSDDEVLASSFVWSAEKNRCYVLMAGARPQSEEGFQFMLVASDKKE